MFFIIFLPVKIIFFDLQSLEIAFPNGSGQASPAMTQFFPFPQVLRHTPRRQIFQQEIWFFVGLH
jgi:hypothetical protein